MILLDIEISHMRSTLGVESQELIFDRGAEGPKAEGPRGGPIGGPIEGR